MTVRKTLSGLMISLGRLGSNGVHEIEVKTQVLLVDFDGILVYYTWLLLLFYPFEAFMYICVSKQCSCAS